MQVHTIDLNFQGYPGTIASFLVEADSGAFLIETGPGSCHANLKARLKDFGYAPSDLDAVFLTHIHLDHAGSAGAFAQAGVPLYVHPKGHRHLVDPTRLIESARMVYGNDFDRLWGDMIPAPEDKVREMVDGEIIRVGGVEVKAIETPGHAFHHHAYLVGESALFAGDAAGARLENTSYTSVTSAPPQFHLEHTLESVDKLNKENCERLFLTHFGEIRNPNTHLEEYRSTVDLNATFISQRLKEGMDENSLRVAYQAFQMEQAFRADLPREMWQYYQVINGSDMCADGIRLYWEKKASEGS